MYYEQNWSQLFESIKIHLNYQNVKISNSCIWRFSRLGYYLVMDIKVQVQWFSGWRRIGILWIFSIIVNTDIIKCQIVGMKFVEGKARYTIYIISSKKLGYFSASFTLIFCYLLVMSLSLVFLQFLPQKKIC